MLLNFSTLAASLAFASDLLLFSRACGCDLFYCVNSISRTWNAYSAVHFVTAHNLQMKRRIMARNAENNALTRSFIRSSIYTVVHGLLPHAYEMLMQIRFVFALVVLCNLYFICTHNECNIHYLISNQFWEGRRKTKSSNELEQFCCSLRLGALEEFFTQKSISQQGYSFFVEHWLIRLTWSVRALRVILIHCVSPKIHLGFRRKLTRCEQNTRAAYGNNDNGHDRITFFTWSIKHVNR